MRPSFTIVLVLLGIFLSTSAGFAQSAGKLVFKSAGSEGLDRLFAKHRTCAYDFAMIDGLKEQGTIWVRGENMDGNYRLGSLGKIIVAMGILKLAEQGKLSLHDPVSLHVPDLQLPNQWNAEEPVRVEHLLEHSSGLDDMHFNEYYLQENNSIPLKTMLARNPASKRIRWRPGTRGAYSNVGYAIAAHMIEVIVKEEADDWLQKNVLDPMGMKNSFFERCEKTNAPIVLGCNELSVVQEGCYLYYPAVGFVSTAKDMGRLVVFLVGNGHVGPDTILKTASMDRIFRSETTSAANRGWFDGDYGLGVSIWGAQNFKRVGATGYLDGHLAILEMDPASKSGWVLMSTDVRHRSEFLADVRTFFWNRLGQAAPKVVLPAQANVASAGEYRFANPRNAVFEFEDNLYARLTVDGQWDDPGVAWAHFPGQEPFLLVFQSQQAEVTSDGTQRFQAFAGKSSEGIDFVLVEGKYFERAESSIWFLRISFEIYQYLAGFFAILFPLVLYFRRRMDWIGNNFWLYCTAVAPYCLGFCGYQMLTSENYRALGSFGLFSASLAMISILIPVFTALSSFLFFRKWPFGLGKYFRLSFFPMVIANWGFTIYLAMFGMVPFVSWTY